jgi:pimeloyl-ACP methyl ester carboxylesterase
MAHGFSGTRDDTLPAFAAGLAVVLFDYRHFGRSTGEPRQLLDIGRQLADYRAAVRFARGLAGVDGARIALWGTSFSGGHVLRLGAEGLGVAAIVAQVPFCDGLATLLTAPPRVALRGTAYGLADRVLALVGAGPLLIGAVGPPGSFAVMTAPDAAAGMAAIVAPQSRWRNVVAARIMLHIARYRPGTTADRIAAPLLVCVADRDDTTPPGPAVAAAERAPRGELLRYAVGHFEAYEPAHREQLIADQLRFLGRHLLGASAPARAVAPAAL